MTYQLSAVTTFQYLSIARIEMIELLMKEVLLVVEFLNDKLMERLLPVLLKNWRLDFRGNGSFYTLFD